MDRLIALVALRFRLEARALLGARGRLVALLVALPLLLLLSAATAGLAFLAARVVEREEPALVLPALSAAAAVLGLAWALSPFLAGVSATETHDLGRLVAYPVPFATLVVSSLAANLVQPMVLAQVPVLVALALGLAGAGPRLLPALAGLALAFALVLATGQAVGIALHAVSRHRRHHDRALLLGLGLGLALSLLPLLLLSPGGAGARRLALSLVERDVFALVPLSWGVRAAVHAGRGEALAFLGWAAGAALALAAAVGVSTLLARRLYRGEADLGEAAGGRSARARMRLPGAVGALVEKDLRVAWRDPRLKALVFSGLVGPLVLLFVLGQGSPGGPRPSLLLAVAVLSGLGAVGANTFAFERQGLALLLGTPLDRLSLLVGKNIALVALRLPVVLAVAVATLLVAGPALVPAVATVALSTLVLAAAADNYLSILFPLPVSAAGRDPSTPASGTRGLGTLVALVPAVLATLAAAAPFAFLAWLPLLLGEPWLAAATLPLALAGAVAVHFMAVAGAARLLGRREGDLVARLAGED